MIGPCNTDAHSGCAFEKIGVIAVVDLGKQSDLIEDIASNDKRAADDALVEMDKLRRIVTVTNERVSTDDLDASMQKADLLIAKKHCVPA
jgi:hypothetical protein